METIRIPTRSRTELLDVTDRVRETVRKSRVQDGLCVLFVPHTTAGVTVNEAYDPDVAGDILATLEKIAPPDAGYRHAEGNADAHVKASCVGSSATIPVEEGDLRLGRWQGIFFCEFDGPRGGRELWVKVIPSGP